MFGTAQLGNLFKVYSYQDKLAVVREVVRMQKQPSFDSAGKYGAGLALEELGKCLEELKVDPGNVMISNKLAWRRVPLTTEEPTFEPGAWFGIKNDAKQDISYDGMMRCFEEGNKLLGKYNANVVSVHDPDEYLAAAKDEKDLAKRKEDIIGAYKALADLRKAGKVKYVGVGAKDVTAIDFISDHVQLDWAMYACSITCYNHPEHARKLLKKLGKQGVAVVNSAIFNAGFLLGGAFFDYAKITRESDPEKFAWRDKFTALCKEYGLKPAAVCVQFSFLFPEIKSVALSTSKPSRVASNFELINTKVPPEFWDKMFKAGLIADPKKF